ncbi:DUF1579 family protein [Pedobacter steynii]|uniref:DUF1579 domain-containing protein n=1 Tax=Pedobacter steynii TaxID=430522 RepID=A0A1D7QIJ8_9SPHI|nr:DUF1579 family protein [Pedobacter steynii]AOM78498.1 hypothetical protein BFS30_15720 [Pedobacter steynii]
MKTPITKPGIMQQRLNVLAGKWNTTGHTIANTDQPSLECVATDIYEWLPGGFFLMHRVDARLGEDRLQFTEIIGYDALEKSFFIQTYDHKGKTERSRMNLNHGILEIKGANERFSGTINTQGNIISGSWERLIADSTWQPYMEIKLTKVGHFS